MALAEQVERMAAVLVWSDELAHPGSVVAFTVALGLSWASYEVWNARPDDCSCAGIPGVNTAPVSRPSDGSRRG
jgi:hypothetical protein